MKWQSLRPSARDYFFEEADEFVSFTEINGIKARGHNLCWHEHLPEWFTSTVRRENARTVLIEHIRTVAGRYAGRMHSWDVVNEAIHPEDGRPDGLRLSPWLESIGEDYIEIAFKTARIADPGALLTYNEFGIESEEASSERKRTATLLLLRRLRQRNIPIDAVGIQSHIRAGSPNLYGKSLRRFIQECRELDLQVLLTEMDVDDRRLPTEIRVRDLGVAETYRSYLATTLVEPNVRGLLTWGVSDNQSWLSRERPRNDGQPQRPLLFANDLHAKPAFQAVTKAMDRSKQGSDDFVQPPGRHLSL